MRLCVQRQHYPLYSYGRDVVDDIGNLRHFRATYQLNAAAYSSGWRSMPEMAGGGAVIDMGYHSIDMLHSYFGPPSRVFAVAAPGMIRGDVEETVSVTLEYENGRVGSLFLSLCEPHKNEELIVAGSAGAVRLRRDSLQRFNTKGDLMQTFTHEGASSSAVIRTLVDFVAHLGDGDVAGDEVKRGLEVMSTIDAIYRSMSTKQPQSVPSVEQLRSMSRPAGGQEPTNGVRYRFQPSQRRYGSDLPPCRRAATPWTLQ